MQMTEGDIRKNYNEAKNKKEQIRILADLNCCSQDVIKKIVMELPPTQESLVNKRTDKDLLSKLYTKLDEIEAKIKRLDHTKSELEEEYRKVTVAIEVIGKLA